MNEKEIDALENLRIAVQNLHLDCGDNSCCYAREKGRYENKRWMPLFSSLSRSGAPGYRTGSALRYSTRKGAK